MNAMLVVTGLGVVIAVLVMTYSSGRNAGEMREQLKSIVKHLDTMNNFMINTRCELTELRRAVSKLQTQALPADAAIDLDHPKEHERIDVPSGI